jgi:hypothetical protein
VTKKYPELFKRTEDGTYRFAKDVTEEAVAAKSDPELQRAWRRASRYEGKGCLNAADNAEGPLARLFLGKKVTDLGGIADIDRVLLEAELAATRAAGLADEAAVSDRARRVAIMQRKGTMGMNAILSLSLALARLSAAIQGKDLWSGIREQMKETAAKTIAANGGVKVLQPEAARKIGAGEGRELWTALKRELTLAELEQALQAMARSKPEGAKLHELLRRELPVYG